MNSQTQALCNFLNRSRSLYHVSAILTQWLEEAGFTFLDEVDDWKLKPGGCYYIRRGKSSVIAFRIPREHPQGYLLSASHCDHPCFKVKENFELGGQYTRLAVEKYGGLIIHPWLDRPLSIAGRVLVDTPSGIETRLIDLDRDIALIPNVAIHLEREVNEGKKWNLAVDTIPLLGGPDAAGKLQALLTEAAGGEILGQDLYLYLRENARVWGVDEEYISSAALDDLQCVYGCARGFINAKVHKSVQIFCVFDGEEVGSNSAQGADGDMLRSTLERISRCMGYDHNRMLAGSFMVSADNAHAIHPNHPELADPTNAPKMNGGVVLKFNANQRYTTDGLASAVFRKICEKANVPTQVYYNRADMRGGATLGFISLNHVSIPSVDIGLPQLAMHSCYETAGVRDAVYLEQAMTAYYNTTLEIRNGNCNVL
jgi:aspartyl aminopeptidase